MNNSLLQTEKPGNGQRVEQANKQLGSGVENAENQVQTTLQNVASPPLQPPWPPTTLIAPLLPNIFVHDFSANPQKNQITD